MKYPANIEEVLQLNPDYLGFIFYRSSKRFIETLPVDFVKTLQGVKKVGVFVNETTAVIQESIKAYGLDLIQLHGDEDPAFTAGIKQMDVQVMKAFGVSTDFDWKGLRSYEGTADYYLFDTKTMDYGGSGHAFDWQLLEQYEQQTPYFLSGGLGPDNIGEIKQMDDERLYAIDVNSKFELSPGIKDVELLRSTFNPDAA